jgi:hypothetical protein
MSTAPTSLITAARSGKDADDVGASADFLVEPLLVGVGPGRGVHRFDGSVSPPRASEPDVVFARIRLSTCPVAVGSVGFVLVHCHGVEMFAAR